LVGIGRCIAHELARLGAIVVIAGRTLDKLLTVQREVRAYGHTIHVVQMNIRDLASVQHAIDSIVQQHGPIYGLVNNAGGQFLAPASTFTHNGWKSVIDLNLNGTWNVIRTCYDACMSEHGGHVVCVVADFRNGMPLMAHTGAARAGVENLCKSLAVEWGPLGIRVNAVAPGTIIGHGMKNYPKDVLERVIANNAWKNPSGRMGTESEVAACVCFLLSPAAAYVTGTTIRVDGGSSLVGGSFGTSSDVLFTRDSKIPAYFGLPNQVATDIPQELKNELERYRGIKAKL
jgi:citronellol/citronellal dehydrogenase